MPVIPHEGFSCPNFLHNDNLLVEPLPPRSQGLISTVLELGTVDFDVLRVDFFLAALKLPLRTELSQYIVAFAKGRIEMGLIPIVTIK